MEYVMFWPKITTTHRKIKAHYSDLSMRDTFEIYYTVLLSLFLKTESQIFILKVNIST